FDSAPKTDPSMQPPPVAAPERVIPPPPASPSRVGVPAVAPPARTAASSTASVARPLGGAQSRPNLTPSRPAIPVAASRTGAPAAPSASRAPVSGIGGRRASSSVAHPYGGGKPTAEGVVVARPAVIVGGDPQGTAPRSTVGTRQRSFTPPPPSSQPAPPQPHVQASKTPTSDNIFGGDLISEKSLDEVILAYLSEDMNEK
ncbi:MAG TPA: hypothetical protein VF945_06615, partial [Polyangia bacterium]